MTSNPKSDGVSPASGPVAELYVAGHAALAICESLLLALNDRKILPEPEIMGILRDAASAHENAPEDVEGLHKAVARLITRIIDNGNSVRRR